MTKARAVAVLTSVLLSLPLVPGAIAQREGPMPKVEKTTVNAPVTLTDNGDSWTLDNGIVKITLAKRDANLSSIVYHGVEILTHGNYSYWEQRPSGTISSSVTIDPASNGGETRGGLRQRRLQPRCNRRRPRRRAGRHGH